MLRYETSQSSLYFPVGKSLAIPKNCHEKQPKNTGADWMILSDVHCVQKKHPLTFSFILP